MAEFAIALSNATLRRHCKLFYAYCQEFFPKYFTKKNDRIVIPNSSYGMPIEETGFEINKFFQENVCEMSRLAIIREARGKISFSNIIFSACMVARSYGATTLLAEILPTNLNLFKRQGFEEVGEPIKDITVQSINNQESIVIPMQKRL